jgi:outer membrane protein assembly factor BamD
MKKVILILIAVVVGCTAACRHSPKNPEELAPLSPQELYRKGMDSYEKGQYVYAYEDFQRCKTRYPISEWGIKSELKVADCLYYQKHYETAFTQYQEFTRLHPTYELIDYVYYQMAMCYYNQMCTIDRDQTFTAEAIKHFERLLRLFPSSPYALSAQEKIGECRDRLAQHIMYIGDFYYRTGAYDAALGRYEEALNNYSDSLAAPDLLMFQMGRLYLRLNRPEEAREQLITLIRDYPESQYAALAEALLENPGKIEEIDSLKITPFLKKLNPLGAIKSIPIPFTKKKHEEGITEKEGEIKPEGSSPDTESRYAIPLMTA